MEEIVNNEFLFYSKLSKPLILNLPKSQDRILAAAWLKKFADEQAGTEKLRIIYLKLLIFCLQRRRLSGIFADDPSLYNTLEELPEDIDLNEFARNLLEEEKLERRKIIKLEMMGDMDAFPAYTTDCSPDLTEYVAAQDIPNFGVHAYYAISKQPVSKWQRSEKAILPKGIKSAIETNISISAAGAEGPKCTCAPKGTSSAPEVEDGGEESFPECRQPKDQSAERPKKKRPKKLGTSPPTHPIGEVKHEEEERPTPTWGTNLVEIREHTDLGNIEEMTPLERDLEERVNRMMAEAFASSIEEESETDEDDLSEKANEMNNTLSEVEKGRMSSQQTADKGGKKKKKKKEEEVEELPEDYHVEGRIEWEPQGDDYFERLLAEAEADIDLSVYDQGIDEDESVVELFDDEIADIEDELNVSRATTQARNASPALTREIPVTTPPATASPKRTKTPEKIFAGDDDYLLRHRASPLKAPKEPQQDPRRSARPAAEPEQTEKDQHLSQVFEHAKRLVEDEDDSFLAHEQEMEEQDRQEDRNAPGPMRYAQTPAREAYNVMDRVRQQEAMLRTPPQHGRTPSQPIQRKRTPTSAEQQAEFDRLERQFAGGTPPRARSPSIGRQQQSPGLSQVMDKVQQQQQMLASTARTPRQPIQQRRAPTSAEQQAEFDRLERELGGGTPTRARSPCIARQQQSPGLSQVMERVQQQQQMLASAMGPAQTPRQPIQRSRTPTSAEQQAEFDRLERELGGGTPTRARSPCIARQQQSPGLSQVMERVQQQQQMLASPMGPGLDITPPQFADSPPPMTQQEEFGYFEGIRQQARLEGTAPPEWNEEEFLRRQGERRRRRHEVIREGSPEANRIIHEVENIFDEADGSIGGGILEESIPQMDFDLTPDPSVPGPVSPLGYTPTGPPPARPQTPKPQTPQRRPPASITPEVVRQYRQREAREKEFVPGVSSPLTPKVWQRPYDRPPLYQTPVPTPPPRTPPQSPPPQFFDRSPLAEEEMEFPESPNVSPGPYIPTYNPYEPDVFDQYLAQQAAERQQEEVCQPCSPAPIRSPVPISPPVQRSPSPPPSPFEPVDYLEEHELSDLPFGPPMAPEEIREFLEEVGQTSPLQPSPPASRPRTPQQAPQPPQEAAYTPPSPFEPVDYLKADELADLSFGPDMSPGEVQNFLKELGEMSPATPYVYRPPSTPFSVPPATPPQTPLFRAPVPPPMPFFPGISAPITPQPNQLPYDRPNYYWTPPTPLPPGAPGLDDSLPMDFPESPPQLWAPATPGYGPTPAKRSPMYSPSPVRPFKQPERPRPRLQKNLPPQQAQKNQREIISQTRRRRMRPRNLLQDLGEACEPCGPVMEPPPPCGPCGEDEDLASRSIRSATKLRTQQRGKYSTPSPGQMDFDALERQFQQEAAMALPCNKPVLPELPFSPGEEQRVRERVRQQEAMLRTPPSPVDLEFERLEREFAMEDEGAPCIPCSGGQDADADARKIYERARQQEALLRTPRQPTELEQFEELERQFAEEEGGSSPAKLSQSLPKPSSPYGPEADAIYKKIREQEEMLQPSPQYPGGWTPEGVPGPSRRRTGLTPPSPWQYDSDVCSPPPTPVPTPVVVVAKRIKKKGRYPPQPTPRTPTDSRNIPRAPCGTPPKRVAAYGTPLREKLPLRPKNLFVAPGEYPPPSPDVRRQYDPSTPPCIGAENVPRSEWSPEGGYLEDEGVPPDFPSPPPRTLQDDQLFFPPEAMAARTPEGLPTMKDVMRHQLAQDTFRRNISYKTPFGAGPCSRIRRQSRTGFAPMGGIAEEGTPPGQLAEQRDLQDIEFTPPQFRSPRPASLMPRSPTMGQCMASVMTGLEDIYQQRPPQDMPSTSRGASPTRMPQEPSTSASGAKPKAESKPKPKKQPKPLKETRSQKLKREKLEKEQAAEKEAQRKKEKAAKAQAEKKRKAQSQIIGVKLKAELSQHQIDFPGYRQGVITGKTSGKYMRIPRQSRGVIDAMNIIEERAEPGSPCYPCAQGQVGGPDDELRPPIDASPDIPGMTAADRAAQMARAQERYFAETRLGPLLDEERMQLEEPLGTITYSPRRPDPQFGRGPFSYDMPGVHLPFRQAFPSDDMPELENANIMGIEMMSPPQFAEIADDGSFGFLPSPEGSEVYPPRVPLPETPPLDPRKVRRHIESKADPFYDPTVQGGVLVDRGQRRISRAPGYEMSQILEQSPPLLPINQIRACRDVPLRGQAPRTDILDRPLPQGLRSPLQTNLPSYVPEPWQPPCGAFDVPPIGQIYQPPPDLPIHPDLVDLAQYESPVHIPEEVSLDEAPPEGMLYTPERDAETDDIDWHNEMLRRIRELPDVPYSPELLSPDLGLGQDENFLEPCIGVDIHPWEGFLDTTPPLERDYALLEMHERTKQAQGRKGIKPKPMFFGGYGETPKRPIPRWYGRGGARNVIPEADIEDSPPSPRTPPPQLPAPPSWWSPDLDEFERMEREIETKCRARDRRTQRERDFDERRRQTEIELMAEESDRRLAMSPTQWEFEQLEQQIAEEEGRRKVSKRRQQQMKFEEIQRRAAVEEMIMEAERKEQEFKRPASPIGREASPSRTPPGPPPMLSVSSPGEAAGGPCGVCSPDDIDRQVEAAYENLNMLDQEQGWYDVLENMESPPRLPWQGLDYSPLGEESPPPGLFYFTPPKKRRIQPTYASVEISPGEPREDPVMTAVENLKRRQEQHALEFQRGREEIRQMFAPTPLSPGPGPDFLMNVYAHQIPQDFREHRRPPCVIRDQIGTQERNLQLQRRSAGPALDSIREQRVQIVTPKPWRQPPRKRPRPSKKSQPAAGPSVAAPGPQRSAGGASCGPTCPAADQSRPGPSTGAIPKQYTVEEGRQRAKERLRAAKRSQQQASRPAARSSQSQRELAMQQAAMARPPAPFTGFVPTSVRARMPPPPPPPVEPVRGGRRPAGGCGGCPGANRRPRTQASASTSRTKLQRPGGCPGRR
ncbi:titin-like isoform X2 [Anthonomus grandis grandis]|uniref:titin-like isoform X2 n=1 Tax=Anthonomus grandis grandis TaxID=2921223 RepID=UPI002166BB7D|nr:titin-like isoform X2 [Anthonomus grandis grandis]